MKIILLALLWSFSSLSSSVTFYYEIKSKKYNRCIKINNTNLDLLECDGKDKWEIWYDETSGQATIKDGLKNWYIINRSAREEKGLWASIKSVFKTSKPSKDGGPTIGVHEHDPSDFLINKELFDKTENVTILNNAEEKCLDVSQAKDRFYIILKKCSNSSSQKWNITRLKEVRLE
jgi:hypothetical protein